MFSKVFKFIVLLLAIILPCQAFWWRSSSTEAPPPPPPSTSPLMKQIPLTYFRTYTYQQPLTSSPIQLPLLSSTDYITNYNALSHTPYFNPMMSVRPLNVATNNEIPAESRPVKGYGNYNLVRSLGALPAASSTITPEPTKTTTSTTTTTTTTTPEPTTTTTTEPPTPTTTTTTTVQMEAASNAIPLNPSDTLSNNMEDTYPTFNRKAFTNHFNINYNRPVYPYPEYSVFKANSLNGMDKNQATPNIEFVPCLCPINIPNAAFSAGIPSNSIFLAQSRTNVETEAPVDMPKPNVSLNVEETAAAEASSLGEDLQLVNLDGEEEAAIPAENTLT